MKHLHPITRILLSLATMFIPLMLLNQIILKPALGMLDIGDELKRLIRFAIMTPLFIIAYNQYFSRSEKRQVKEFSLTGMWREASAGFLLSSISLLLPVGLLIFLGVYEIQVNDIPIYFVLYPLLILFFLALGEEILFRGITFRILEESVGTLLALLLSASLFGALHMTNNSATVASTISVIILGLLWGASFKISGRLWLPIFAHLGWNFTHIFFGLTVSGEGKFAAYAPFSSTVSGSSLITGGGFGPEGSIVVILFNSVFCFLIFAYLYKRGLILSPSHGRLEAET